MRWKGGEQSENLEDRRSIGGKGLAMGGGGVLIILLLGWFFGIEPQKLNKLIGQAGVGADPNAAQRRRRAYSPGKGAARVCRHGAQIHRGRVERPIPSRGQVYEVPHMVLFSNRVQTGCGVAHRPSVRFTARPIKRFISIPPSSRSWHKNWEAQKPSFHRPM